MLISGFVNITDYEANRGTWIGSNMIEKHSEPDICNGYASGRFLSPHNTIGWMSVRCDSVSGYIDTGLNHYIDRLVFRFLSEQFLMKNESSIIVSCE